MHVSQRNWPARQPQQEENDTALVTIIVKDLGSGLEPDWFLEVDASCVAQELREDTSKGSQHSPPAFARLNQQVCS